MSELKPCPFCGNKLNSEYTISYDYIRKCYVLYHECTFLRCHIAIYGATQEECIAAWNRRAQPANEPLTLEQMQGLLERLEAECREAGDGREDYTNGYRWGHRNGQIELLRRILNVREGACESDLRREPEGSENE